MAQWYEILESKQLCSGKGSDMSINRKMSRDLDARRWAKRLMNSVNAVLAIHPKADPDNVRHTFILLEQPPLERLRRSLLRGRAITQSK
jgi:hypothetical protein